VTRYAERFSIGVSLGVVLLLSGCTKPQAEHKSEARAPAPQPVAVKQAPPTPVETKRVELGNGPSWDPGWDTFIERSLPAEMLSSQVPRDVRRFCPRFFEMNETDKRAYWAYFFQALAAAEAGLDPKTNVRHTEPEVAVVDPVTERMTHSEGLLQLSYHDQKRYDCNFDWEADRKLPPKDSRKTILQPENNLACGIKILDTQIIAQHKALFARTSYWSTLQPGTVSYRVFAKQMTNPPAACGLHEARPRRRMALSDEHAAASVP
jgi:hypothetical protein